jgi:hypothetical protein
MSRRTVWRVTALPGIHHQVLEICRKENRSVANCVSTLVAEAIDTRRRANMQTDDVKKLVSILKGAIAQEPADA